jgi:hypothetical protein
MYEKRLTILTRRYIFYFNLLLHITHHTYVIGLREHPFNFVGGNWGGGVVDYLCMLFFEEKNFTSTHFMETNLFWKIPKMNNLTLQFSMRNFWLNLKKITDFSCKNKIIWFLFSHDKIFGLGIKYSPISPKKKLNGRSFIVYENNGHFNIVYYKASLSVTVDFVPMICFILVNIFLLLCGSSPSFSLCSLMQY